MRRLHLAFAGLALGLLLPSALLVARALEGLAAEREARHRVVSDRIFDEMERALSALVAREEARPVEAWRFDAREDGSPGGRSPLARAPAEPFVLGYFQVEPDGTLSSPLRPADAVEAAERNDEPLAPEALRAARRALEVAGAWLAGEGDDSARGAADATQAPGTTVQLGERGAAGPQPQVDAAPERESPRAAAPSAAVGSAWEALDSLNRGARERGERLRRTFEESAAQARVAVDPLVGRLADAHHLLLYRTVWTEGRAIRQGLVLEVAPLEAWLRERALGAPGLAGARLAFGSAAAAPGSSPATGVRLYRHRFAEPFDALRAELALPALAGARGEGAVHALAALLLVAGAAGLLAIHRMVSVTVGFAERRSNFVAAVTHELRTPLTAIRLHGEMLRDGLVASEARRRAYYRTITVECERLGRLVDDVLELSRLERGIRAMRVEPGPIGPVVEEAARLLAPQAERAGFELAVDVDPDLPPARFERDSLLRVLLNLIDNALKYARDASERRIRIEVRRLDAGGVGLAVRDHGPGVPHRHLPHVFEPFHRAGDELTRTTQGMGLGLALVKGLVERMGGAVAGRNRPEGGFEVRMRFAGRPGDARSLEG